MPWNVGKPGFLVALSKCKQPSLSFVDIAFGTQSYFTLLKFLSWKMHGTAFTSAKPSCIYLTGCREDLCVNIWKALVLSEASIEQELFLLSIGKKCNIDKLCIGIDLRPKLFPDRSYLPVLLPPSVTRGSLVGSNLDWRNWDFYGPGYSDLLPQLRV